MRPQISGTSALQRCGTDAHTLCHQAENHRHAGHRGNNGHPHVTPLPLQHQEFLPRHRRRGEPDTGTQHHRIAVSPANRPFHPHRRPQATACCGCAKRKRVGCGRPSLALHRTHRLPQLALRTTVARTKQQLLPYGGEGYGRASFARDGPGGGFLGHPETPRTHAPRYSRMA